MKKSVWSTILKVIIAVATAIAGAFGLQACNLFSVEEPTPLPPKSRDGSPSGLSGRALSEATEVSDRSVPV
mgnify:CR=1 FL=1